MTLSILIGMWRLELSNAKTLMRSSLMVDSSTVFICLTAENDRSVSQLVIGIKHPNWGST